jgi:TonB family protein
VPEDTEWPLLYASARQAPQWHAGASPSPAVAPSSGLGRPWAASLTALLLAALVWYGFSDWSEDRFNASTPAHRDGVVTAEQTAVAAEPQQAGPATGPVAAASSNATAWDAAALDDSPLGPSPYVGIPLKQVEPIYPLAAKNAGVEGLVIVTYTLDAQGKARDLQVAKSVPMLDEAVLSALRQWEYPPVPAGVTPPNYRYNVEFVLDDWRR